LRLAETRSHNGAPQRVRRTLTRIVLSELPSTHRSPLIVGVSGHRDLNVHSDERARREVGRFLDDLTRLVPNTPVRVMVGMAEGADLLVARTALDRNLGVDAVLPMPL
jgi:hypothetical protein